MLVFARFREISRRVQVSFPALTEPIKIGGLSTAFIECKQKCKQAFQCCYQWVSAKILSLSTFSFIEFYIYLYENI